MQQLGFQPILCLNQTDLDKEKLNATNPNLNQELNEPNHKDVQWNER